MLLFVRGPGVLVGSKMEKLALNTDLAPTFADLVGVEFPADGRSLTPILRGEEPSVWRSAILLEKLEKPKSGEEESGKGKGKKGKGKDKGKAANPPDYQAIRTGTHKYVEYDNGERELYDLQNDPYELESLHESADPSLLEDLKAKLDVLKSCSEEGCREAEDAL